MKLEGLIRKDVFQVGADEATVKTFYEDISSPVLVSGIQLKVPGGESTNMEVRIEGGNTFVIASKSDAVTGRVFPVQTLQDAILLPDNGFLGIRFKDQSSTEHGVSYRLIAHRLFNG